MANWGVANTGKPDGADLADVDLIAARIDNNEGGLSGELSLTTIDINGGAIDDTPIGGTTPSTADFTHLVASTVDMTSNASITGTLDVVGAFVASSTGDIGTTLDVGSGISAGSGDKIKWDIISGAYSFTAGGSQDKTYAHGHSTNVRGVTGPYLDGDIPGGTVQDSVYVDGTNIVWRIVNGVGTGSGTVYFVVFYV